MWYQRIFEAVTFDVEELLLTLSPLGRHPEYPILIPGALLILLILAIIERGLGNGVGVKGVLLIPKSHIKIVTGLIHVIAQNCTGALLDFLVMIGCTGSPTLSPGYRIIPLLN